VRIPMLCTISLFVIAMLVLPGCSSREEVSALYILEELEAASAVGDPEEKVERLNIFTENHRNHPYRLLGYERVLEVLVKDMNDIERAQKFFDDLLEKERDIKIRGNLHFARFENLWETDREAAIAIARSLLEGDERHYRLFLYMGYYLMDDEKQLDLAERCLERARDLASHSIERNQAITMIGKIRSGQGRKDDAVEILQGARGNPVAQRYLGELFWDAGKKEEALDAYIRFVASYPGAREKVSLDSLYALVYQGSSDLDEMIMDARIRDEGPLPDEGFVDVEGKSYRLTGYRGTNLVVNIWSPT